MMSQKSVRGMNTGSLNSVVIVEYQVVVFVELFQIKLDVYLVEYELILFRLLGWTTSCW